LEENELQAESEFANALLERDEAQKRLDRANEALHAWRVLKRQARDALGMTDTDVADGTNGEAVTEHAGNRTQYVRSMVALAGTNGTTAGDILEAAREAYPEIIGPNFPYAQLSKLKATKEVWTNKKGGYFIAGDSQA
jgi:hypothetical protein